VDDFGKIEQGKEIYFQDHQNRTGYHE